MEKEPRTMEKPRYLSTIAKRKALAALVSQAASAALGVPVMLTRSEYDPDEFSWRLEDAESERGAVHHISIDVCPRGVNVHVKFADPSVAPVGANPHSGKWNHYLWPDADDTAESYGAWVTEEVGRLMRKIQLRPGVARADRPSRADAIQAWLDDLASAREVA